MLGRCAPLTRLCESLHMIWGSWVCDLAPRVQLGWAATERHHGSLERRRRQEASLLICICIALGNPEPAHFIFYRHFLFSLLRPSHLSTPGPGRSPGFSSLPHPTRRARRSLH
ncbi:hypothetical protein K505DRAFT_149070 [Melanomma pulvis-pyrius CBS 109.77]|uniref:Uncharacterized protein n=1 Tax=Melanomma pulvis-pyrius CBS 109.77 TaxID=1314802 RepID=A0A6A6WQ83_9PLEO|nr:hypothetical protein K505DRAFT_149070 [Melanomma pulvis-pyrius CBS 109.77]